MANETLKAGFDKYMAGVEAKLAKNPERANHEGQLRRVRKR